jgi:hypothetical protein
MDAIRLRALRHGGQVGRVTDLKEYNSAGTSVVYEAQSTYNNDSELTQQVTTVVCTENPIWTESWRSDDADR